MLLSPPTYEPSRRGHGGMAAACRDGFGPQPPSRETLLRILLAGTAAALALATATVRGDSGRLSPVRPTLEQRMLDDAADGRLDDFTRFEALLIAGGVGDERQLTEYSQTIEGFAAALSLGNSPQTGRSPWETARAIHDWLHGHVLTGVYTDDAADVRTTLAGGPFNCLTATVLFGELCRRQGFSVEAVATPGHVFARIAAPSGSTWGKLDVQTTGRDWRTAASPASAQPVEARVLSDIEMAAKVYYNRGVRSHRQGRFDDAVKCLRIACSLDPADRDSQQNLLATINNWSLAECAAGRFAQATALLVEGERAAATNVPFADNDVYVACRWAESLCSAGKFVEALAVLEAATRRQPQVELLVEAVNSVKAAQRNKQ